MVDERRSIICIFLIITVSLSAVLVIAIYGIEAVIVVSFPRGGIFFPRKDFDVPLTVVSSIDQPHKVASLHHDSVQGRNGKIPKRVRVKPVEATRRIRGLRTIIDGLSVEVRYPW